MHAGKEYNGSAVDIWSLGIILYELLMGETPFKGNSQAALFKVIVKGVYQPVPNTFSPQCRDLVTKMLTVNSEKRISIGSVETHPWLAKADGALIIGEEEPDASAASSFSSLKLVLPGMAIAAPASPAVKPLDKAASLTPAQEASTAGALQCRIMDEGFHFLPSKPI